MVVIKSYRMGSTGHVARMWKIVVGNPERKRPRERPSADGG
jgi:hypothetical protein